MAFFDGTCEYFIPIHGVCFTLLTPIGFRPALWGWLNDSTLKNQLDGPSYRGDWLYADILLELDLMIALLFLFGVGGFQEISNRTHWTDPSTWESHSSSNFLRGPLVRSHSIFDGRILFWNNKLTLKNIMKTLGSITSSKMLRKQHLDTWRRPAVRSNLGYSWTFDCRWDAPYKNP